MASAETEKENRFRDDQREAELGAVTDVLSRVSEIQTARADLERNALAFAKAHGIPDTHAERIVRKILNRFDDDIGTFMSQEIESLSASV